MSKKQAANIQYKKNNIVEKAVILPKSIQLKMDFDIKVTAWIPKAQKNKPMPQINLTMSAGYDGIRLGADTTEQIIESLMHIVAHLEANKNTLDKKAQEQRKTWIDICNSAYDSSTNKSVKLKKVV